ncbi:MAG: AI-2E family transporter [Clostridia bacterium]|nr:AI-2E family transporter [Clostridia bacterium]
MKLDWKSHDRETLPSKILVLVGVLVAGVLLYIWREPIGSVVKTFVNAVKPLIYAVIIAYILWPMLRFFENKVFAKLNEKKLRRRLVRILSLLCTYIIFLLLLTLFFSTVIPQVSDSFRSLVDRLRDYIDSGSTWIDSLTAKYPFLDGVFESNLFEMIQTNLNDWLKESINKLDSMNKLVENISTIFDNVSSVAVGMKNVVLGIVFAVYFLLYKESLFAQLKKLTKSVMKDRAYERFTHYAKLTDHTFGGFISGKLIDSIIVGLLCFILMKIFRMPYASLIAMIIGITNVIPFFGPFIGAIPSAFFIFVAEPKMTLWFILLIVVLQQLDGNVIGPKILGDFVGLSPLWIIVAITIMGGIFGIWGMFFGVPTFAVIYAVVKELTERKLEANALPRETDEYYQDLTYKEIVKPQRHEIPFKNNVESAIGQLIDKIRKNGGKS